jgi:hypothetical protein
MALSTSSRFLAALAQAGSRETIEALRTPSSGGGRLLAQPAGQVAFQIVQVILVPGHESPVPRLGPQARRPAHEGIGDDPHCSRRLVAGQAASLADQPAGGEIDRSVARIGDQDHRLARACRAIDQQPPTEGLGPQGGDTRPGHLAHGLSTPGSAEAR